MRIDCGEDYLMMMGEGDGCSECTRAHNAPVPCGATDA
jgi:hypothetical protein